MHSSLDLETLNRTLVDSCIKGLPPSGAPITIGEIPQQGWNLLGQDLPLPVAVLKESALVTNSRWMKSFLARNECLISPHGKTTMAPQLFQRQLADGAWAITAATPTQVQAYRRFGVGRILLANQLIDPHGIAFVMEELRRDPDFDFYCLVDSMDGLRLLAAAAERYQPGRPVQVLLEVGTPGGRTGVRTVEACMELARSIAAVPHVSLRGVEAYENVFTGPGERQIVEGIRLLMTRVMDVVARSRKERLFASGPIIVSAGGSAYFDVVAQATRELSGHSVQLVLRSGCYLTHDDGLIERAFVRIQQRLGASFESVAPPVPALEVWAHVQSCPEPGVAFATVGKRDVSYDFDPPRPTAWYRPGLHARPEAVKDQCRVTKLNDQHARLESRGSLTLAVGDMVSFGVSHPCTTFDKWPLLYIVDDDYNVVEGIRTFF